MMWLCLELIESVAVKYSDTVNNSFQEKFSSANVLTSHPCSGWKHTSKYWSFLLNEFFLLQSIWHVSILECKVFYSILWIWIGKLKTIHSTLFHLPPRHAINPGDVLVVGCALPYSTCCLHIHSWTRHPKRLPAQTEMLYQPDISEF